MASTFHVDASAGNGGNGSQGSPFKTIPVTVDGLTFATREGAGAITLDLAGGVESAALAGSHAVAVNGNALDNRIEGAASPTRSAAAETTPSSTAPSPTTASRARAAPIS